MSDTKYYILEPDELCCTLELWHKDDLSPSAECGDGETIGELISGRRDCSEYRCKWLDADDIISLGWKQTSTMFNSIAFEKPNMLINFYPAIHKIDVWRAPLQCLFSGVIRNKSELKKLMQQLGI